MKKERINTIARYVEMSSKDGAKQPQASNVGDAPTVRQVAQNHDQI